MVLETEVLSRVQDFEQRRRRVPAEVRGHLVDFVQHENRILRAGLLHTLKNLAGKGADVSPAMAADFGFIAYAAERKANKFTASGLGDRHAERRLPHAGRSDEAEYGSLGVFHQAANREEF